MSASREEIINEIRKLAAMNNGEPPGRRLFRRRTNIHPAEWQGGYWAIWSDALKEAGFQPNLKTEKLDEEFMLIKLAEACRHFDKFPSMVMSVSGASRTRRDVRLSPHSVPTRTSTNCCSIA